MSLIGFQYQPTFDVPASTGCWGFREHAFRFGYNAGVKDGKADREYTPVDPGMIARGTVEASHYGYSQGWREYNKHQ